MRPPIDLAVVSRVLPVIQATGQLACPQRKGSELARDRCVAFQREGVCRCPMGDAAIVAWREHRRVEAKEAERLAAAREAYKHTAHPPWQLKCKNRTCPLPGHLFEAPRGFHRKPDYCSAACRGEVERKARKKAARRRARGLELVSAAT